jgi:hypothetical protein
MRYRTAGILSVVLIGGLFGLPAAVNTFLLPSLDQGVIIPLYERILLGVAIFCLTWRFLLALPIVVVLFTIAIFTNESVAKDRAAAATRVRRPTGVTVIAVINILAGFAVTASLLLLSSQRPQGVLFGIFVTAALLGFGLGVALLKLQNWARVLTILGCVLSLIAIPARVVIAHSLVNAMAALVRGLYFLWMVWYLLQPQIKAAFGRHR